MNPIEIDCNETVCGITVSLAFSISSEAFLNELQDVEQQSQISCIPTEFQEKLAQAVHMETKVLLDQARQKLRLSLFSSFVKLLKMPNQ